ncbi:hypothetical protein BGW36DRAFT_398260 [Talaromyces proteolyticus]|uniref:Impact N-terminal domain-containing protein n=1 Tax=Talaromyces proteolyticus TaxID=1131652 RepID=A0AAD4KRI1_9EURO|nr:uncharacterized protein BGW36DRAFT_398260 [Talaromyces proteolyticus]KAH8694907.1 hypothetical protein BGW36DRAFT_398260 [Talaromyces proteolyticus]
MAAQLQALLRFLSQDAKVPLASAMGKVKELQAAGLDNAQNISSANLKTIQSIFKDDKIAKQVHNAAKRVTKQGDKRAASDDSPSATSPQKRAKTASGNKLDRNIPATPFQIESALSLPITSPHEQPEEYLSDIILTTNRAPLVLAFAVIATKYTMPEQPLSSRLSLAQAVVSANSRSKAVSIGLESGRSAEEEGWGKGQPTIKILGREIAVLKRWDYDPNEGAPPDAEDRPEESQSTLPSSTPDSPPPPPPPLWGLDLESLRRKSNESGKPAHGGSSNEPGLPIYTAESARAYLLKSFIIDKNENAGDNSKLPKKKVPKPESPLEKERALGLLLRALDIVFASWAATLSPEELDKRAWMWYLRVRPDVQSGVAGWGEKGKVKLADILALKR